MSCVRRDVGLMFLGAVVFAILISLQALLAGDLRNPELPVIITVFSAIFILPALGFGLWETVRIFRRAECYRLYRAKLASPHGGQWVRDSMYFTVLLEDEEGKFVVNTRAIFSASRWTPLRLEDYLNKTVTIAYNEETEAVVVIG